MSDFRICRICVLGRICLAGVAVVLLLEVLWSCIGVSVWGLLP